MKLVQFPQSKAILDIDSIVAIGQTAPDRFTVAFRGTNAGSVIMPGDMKVLLALLKERDQLQVVEDVPADQAANEAGSKVLVAESGAMGAKASR